MRPLMHIHVLLVMAWAAESIDLLMLLEILQTLGLYPSVASTAHLYRCQHAPIQEITCSVGRGCFTFENVLTEVHR